MDILHRVIKIETTLPTLATKEDLASLRAEMHKEFSAQTWRLIGWTSMTMTALVGVLVYLAKAGLLKP